MARPRKKLKLQGKVTANNQQVNVVANEEEMEVEQRIIMYIPTLKVNLYPTPILESKFVVMDDTFHMIGFKRVQCNTLQIKNPNPNPKPHLLFLFENGDGVFFGPKFSKQYLHCLKVLIARIFAMPSLYLMFIF
jgi:hypothetical protein